MTSTGRPSSLRMTRVMLMSGAPTSMRRCFATSTPATVALRRCSADAACTPAFSSAELTVRLPSLSSVRRLASGSGTQVVVYENGDWLSLRTRTIFSASAPGAHSRRCAASSESATRSKASTRTLVCCSKSETFSSSPLKLARLVRLGGGSANVPRPCWRRISPSSCSMLSALRMVTRETPNDAANSCSVGIDASATHSPSRTRCDSTVYTW